jgi:RHS repeat-associated protein
MRPSGVVRRRGGLFSLLCMLALFSAAWAISPQAMATGNPESQGKSCNYSGGNPCPETPAMITPWYYIPNGYPTPGYYLASVSEFVAWWQNYTISNGNYGACLVPYLGETLNPNSTFTQYGQIVQQSYYENFNLYNIQNGSCSYYIAWNYANLLHDRNWYCPDPAAPINYQASPLVGPYCGSPSILSDVTTKVGPSCPCGGGATSGNEGGAAPGSGQNTKMGSVNASNGDTFLTQTDYAGAGVDPIQFVRTYNSMAGPWYQTNVPPVTAGFMGTSWAATYFQFLIPMSMTDSTGTYNSVQAYRPDGRVIAFNEYNSVYSPDGDVPDSLMALSGGGWEYQTADDTIETYNSLGQLVSVAPRGKAAVTVNYASGAVLGDPPTSVTDAFGHTLTFAYAGFDNQLRLTSITDPQGHTVAYNYDSNANLTNVTNLDSTTQAYTYSNVGQHLLGTFTDEASNAYMSWTYNGSGQTVTSQLAGGVDAYTFSYSLSGSGGSVTITDPLSQSRTYNQSLIWGSYRMTSASATCPGCQEEASLTYDANGNMTVRTDFNGNTNHYAYNLQNNLETSRTEAYGTSLARTITTVWDTNWRQPDSITEPKRKTTFNYDSMGNVLTKTITDTTVTPNVTRTWTYTYDSYGRMLTATGPRTDVSSTYTYTYYTCTTGYQCGELDTVTDPVGNVTTYNTYNAHGQPLTITDPNGVVTTLTYDNRLRLLSRQVGTETTSFSYYPIGLLQTITLPDSSAVTYTYDAAHRLTKITDTAGNYISYTLDNMGNRTGEQSYDPSSTLHRTHTRVFNALNQLYQDVNAAGTSAVTTTYGYDSNSNQTSIDAPMTRNTTNGFDALNRLNKITDPNTGVTNFTYDPEDDLTKVQDPRSLNTTYTYNGFSDVTKLVSPDTGTSTDTYDSGGNLSVAKDARSATANYTYDKANRVTQIVYKNSGGTIDQTLTFGYDAGTYGKGRLTSSGDGNHSLSWIYDFAGRVTGKGLTVGTVNLSVGYAYTNADLTAITTPSGQSITYTYNSNHQVTSIKVGSTTLLSNVTYEPFGGVNGWTWGDSSTVSRTFNGDGLISQIVTAGVTLGYTFDNANRITGISDSSNSTLSWTYGYDVLDRLNSASTTANSYGWTYDANGNRTAQTTTNATTFNVSTTSNRLSSTTGTLVRTYTYDADGHTTKYASTTFTYNDRGRMSKGGTTQYLYNALGQMYEKSGSATVYLMYDEAGHLIGEYNSTGGLIEETVWLGDIPVAVLTPNGSSVNIYYVHSDHLNTPKKVAQPTTATLAWRWDTDPFGMSAPNQNPGGLGTFVYNLRLPGQYYQSETGLNYNYNRDYDPLTGSYVESDLIGLDGGVNTYGYVGANPLTWSDPQGLFQAYPHNHITKDAIAITGTSCPNLPQAVALADWVTGAQLPKNSYWHAMRDGTNPNDTVETARDNYQKFVNDQMATCSCEGLARALHAVQDSFAAGHVGFQPWSGGFFGIPSPIHFYHDMFPTDQEWSNAVIASAKLLDRYNNSCPSCSKTK